jgi:hypothetical protein
MTVYTNFNDVQADTFTGDVIGNVAGNVTGNITGNVVGQHRHSAQTLSASGAITLSSGLVLLAHNTTPIAATKAAPVEGDELIIVNTSATGTAAHTVKTPAGVTWDGSNNTATLDAPGDALHVIAVSATRWFILENIGTVGLSNT